jgi:hypothetical protein
MNLKLLTLLVLVLGLAASLQAAVPLDLTINDATGFINGGYFVQVPDQSTGTGVIQPFLHIQKNGIESGYNSDDPQPDAVSPWTKALALDDVPVVGMGGINYRQFLLDINEDSGGSNELLSLDKLSLYVGDDPNALGTKIWDMDAGPDGNTWIKLDYALESGSGSGDMLAYIPDSLFTGGSFVNLYSQFGEQGGGEKKGLGSSDGFEEWAVIGPSSPVPEPGVILAALSILCPAGLIFRRKK